MIRFPLVSPRAFRQVALVAAVLLGVIVVTGATVRLTSSGLGCPTWPKCTDTSLIAPDKYHALVEFTNRIITILVGVLVGLVALASLLRAPRRPDLTWLSWSLVAGFCGQAVIGGLSVLYHLAPPWVIAHFLLSMLLMWAALVLVHRANPAWLPVEPRVRRELLLLGRLLVVVAGCVLILGTITTGAGPHAGSGAHVQRLHISLLRITQLHADSALLLTGLIVATVVAIRISDAPPTVRRRSYWLVGAVVAQVAIGYTQYFLNLPPSVVELHVAGATLLWSTTVWLQLGYTAPTRQAGSRALAPPPAEDGLEAPQRRATLSLVAPPAAGSVRWPKMDTIARPRAVEIEDTPDPGTNPPY